MINNEININDNEKNEEIENDDIMTTVIDDIVQPDNTNEVMESFNYLSNEVLDVKKYSLEEANKLINSSKPNQEIDEKLYNDDLSDIQEKQVVKGTVVGSNDKGVIIDIGFKSEGVIDRNEFKAEIFIKPARSINFITLSFVATRTGVSFDEVAG